MSEADDIASDAHAARELQQFDEAAPSTSSASQLATSSPQDNPSTPQHHPPNHPSLHQSTTPFNNLNSSRNIPFQRLCLLPQLLQHIRQIKPHQFSPQPHWRNLPIRQHQIHSSQRHIRTHLQHPQSDADHAVATADTPANGAILKGCGVGCSNRFSSGSELTSLLATGKRG
jgi:hypothetical protein